jgi:hypothetical protein
MDKLAAIARPMGLYVFYLVCIIFTIGLIFTDKLDALTIGAVLVPLGGVGGTYVVKRTEEKLENKA